MARGWKFWADSYIRLSTGETIYLEDDYYDLKEKMKICGKIIEVNVTGILTAHQECFRKSEIVDFGKVE